jgi:hypothetical protein
MTRFFAACTTHAVVGCAVAPRIGDPAAGVLDHREHVHPRPGQGDRFQEVAGQQGVGL